MYRQAFTYSKLDRLVKRLNKRDDLLFEVLPGTSVNSGYYTDSTAIYAHIALKQPDNTTWLNSYMFLGKTETQARKAIIRWFKD